MLFRSTMLCGEDIHFSYMLQKYTDLKTYVPPHPSNDTSMWSSLKASLYGSDQHATAYVNLDSGEMAKYLQYCIDNGFVLYIDRNN